MSLSPSTFRPTAATFALSNDNGNSFFDSSIDVHAGRRDVTFLGDTAHEVHGTLPAGTLTSSRDDGIRNQGGTRSSGSARSSAESGQASRTAGSSSPRESSTMSGDAMSSSASRYSPRNSVTQSDVESVEDGRTYHLEVVQHPERTSELGTSAVLSRLPLSPPLVVRLTVRDASGTVIPAHMEMPFLTAHLNLYSEDGSEPIDLVEGHPSYNGGGERQRMLYGTLVSSLHSLKDLEGQPGMFFIFADISVRKCGRYTLRVHLLPLTSPAGGTTVMPEGMQNAALASVTTNAFSVVLQSEYSAPPSTALTNSFHRQGARMYTPFQPR